jgi:hypothetical protein
LRLATKEEHRKGSEDTDLMDANAIFLEAGVPVQVLTKLIRQKEKIPEHGGR